MIEITENDFEEEVLGCESIVFTCFIAPWCHNCYPVCIVSSELEKEYSGTVKFVKINVENSPKMAVRYQITTVPTVLIFQGSQPVKRIIGFQEHSYLRDTLNSISGESSIFH